MEDINTANTEQPGQIHLVSTGDTWKVCLPNGQILDSRHKCPKCQAESTYDPKEFHGLCPSCWAKLEIGDRSAFTGEWYTYCAASGCDYFTTDKDEWKDTHSYCQECWAELTPQHRAILNGQEPPPKVETKVVTVSLPAVPSLWRVVAAACLGTLLGLSVLGGVVYWMFVH